MSPEMHLFLLLALVKYLQVVNSVDEIHNTNSSGNHNISLLEANTLSDQGSSIFQNDANINGSGYGEANVKQPSKQTRRRENPIRKEKQFPNVNTTTIGEQDTGIAQVRSSKSSSDMLTISNREQPCEAMVLTYGPIGFTSALDLINNASERLHRPVKKKYQHETPNRSGENVKGRHEEIFKDLGANITSQEVHLNRTSTLSRVLEMYKLESNGHLLKSPDRNNHQLKLPKQNNKKRHNKQISKTLVSKNTASLTRGMVVKRNAQIVKMNEGDQSGLLEKAHKTALVIQENDETCDGDKYSVLRLLQPNLPSSLYETVQMQTSDSSSQETLQPNSKCKCVAKLKQARYILNKSAISDNCEQPFEKTGKPCPKQPKFIDKIAIDRKDYNNNQKINAKQCGIDKKLREEHLKAKTELLRIRDQLPSNERTGKRENSGNKDIDIRVSEDNYDVWNKNVNGENGQREKHMEKRYIPQLHPMPQTEDDEKKKDADTAGYLIISRGRTQLDGKSSDEIKKELVDYFSTWPKTREWLYSEQNSKEYHQKNVSSLPIPVYEDPVYYDHSEHLLSNKMYNENAEEPQHASPQASVYADNTNPYQLPPKSPFYCKLNHKIHESNCTQHSKENCNPQQIVFESTREADYYPVDYQSLLPQYQYDQNSCVEVQMDINENSRQANIPACDNLESKPSSISRDQTNQPVSLTDYFKNPQTVAIIKKSTKTLQDNSKAKLIKILVKQTDKN